MHCSLYTVEVNRKCNYRFAIIRFHVKKALGGWIFLCREVVRISGKITECQPTILLCQNNCLFLCSYSLSGTAPGVKWWACVLHICWGPGHFSLCSLIWGFLLYDFNGGDLLLRIHCRENTVTLAVRALPLSSELEALWWQTYLCYGQNHRTTTRNFFFLET